MNYSKLLIGLTVIINLACRQTAYLGAVSYRGSDPDFLLSNQIDSLLKLTPKYFIIKQVDRESWSWYYFTKDKGDFIASQIKSKKDGNFYKYLFLNNSLAKVIHVPQVIGSQVNSGIYYFNNDNFVFSKEFGSQVQNPSNFLKDAQRLLVTARELLRNRKS